MSRGRITDRRLLIIAHRGASAAAPENTHAAFERAFQDGADGIELDVRLARDGVPVVFHDVTFERTVGIYGDIESYSSEMISKAYAGMWFNDRHPRRARDSYGWEKVPTLEQVYERYATGTIYVEMKCEDASRRAELARAVVEMTRAHGVTGRVVLKSFEHDSLGEAKRLAPEIRTAALFGRTWPRPLVPAARIIAEAEACGADEISLHHSLVRGATVEEAHRRGFEVVVWTVNSFVWLLRAVALDLRAVITDRPGWLNTCRVKKLPRLAANPGQKG